MAYKNGSKQTGGKAYSQHTSLKEFIRKRDNYTCQLCGQPGRDVDHIIPYAVSHDSSISNLRCLCHKCNVAVRRPRHDASPFNTIEDYYSYLKRELSLCSV